MNRRTNRRSAAGIVAQIFNLLYRRFLIGRASDGSTATGDFGSEAEWNSAIRQIKNLRYGWLLLALFLLPPVRAETAPAKPVVHATLAAASDAAAADQSLVLLVFSAEWCGPCKLLQRETLDSKEFQEQAGALHLADVDVDADEKTARSFAVSAVPTLVLMTAEGKIVARQTGFMHNAEILPWLQEGRRRAKAGEWDGTAPGSRFKEFVTKAATDRLGTNDLRRLIALLGESDPAERAGAARILIGQREAAVPQLINATGDSYLGVRIAAGEILQRLAPGQVSIDPWQSPAELATTVASLKKWWTDTGKLPPATETRVVDAATETTIKTALDDLRGDDPVRRTEAMATLVGLGPAALPAVREAIKRNERGGNQRAVVLLEDVRWAILVPDTLERRSAGLRNALARGKGQERQAAATRLGKLGRDAMPALTELVNDTDPLVVESAVRALSSAGGKDAIPAMAALLQAADSNLRMTAAQALGHTKSIDALKPLLTVCDDPNEVVACTALAALEEVGPAKAGTTKGSLPEDVSAALKHALADSRWRVRASAVEVVGKISAKELTPDVKKLLHDPDGFVVRSTLEALDRLGATPDTDQLAALGKRLPALRTDTIELMLESETDDTIKRVTEFYNASSINDQVAILNLLTRRSASADKPDDTWKPLLAQATTANDVRLRRAAAEILATRSSKLAAELVGPLLSDEDRETRITAAGVVLGIAAGKNKQTTGHGMSTWSSTSASSTKTNKSPASSETVAAWHAALLQRAESPPDLRVAAAIFVTGDGKSDLPMLAAALEKPDAKAIKQIRQTTFVAAVLSKLPWPEGTLVLEKFCGSPVLFAMAARESLSAAPPVMDYLLKPERFRVSVEGATREDLTTSMQLLVGYTYGEQKAWSLFSGDTRARAIAEVLVTTPNAGWRAAAIYCLGLNEPGRHLATFERALAESNVWVRLAALQSLARDPVDRPKLEQRFGPLVGDHEAQVARLAAITLLEPEVRQMSSLAGGSEYFQYENVHGGFNVNSSAANADRPLSVVEGHPAFLEDARRRLDPADLEDSAVFAVLLAQYGDFKGIDWLIERRPASAEKRRDTVEEGILTGITLSHDAKYLPVLRRMMETRTTEWELRPFLKGLQGMTGAEARQLRLEINKKIRQTTGSPGGVMMD